MVQSGDTESTKKEKPLKRKYNPKKLKSSCIALSIVGGQAEPERQFGKSGK